jgi:hypothetical protein
MGYNSVYYRELGEWNKLLGRFSDKDMTGIP